MKMGANQKPKPDIYVSVDIETTGDIPPINSMISLGAVAFTRAGAYIDSFKVNIAWEPGSVMDPYTQKFWDKHPEAFKATLDDVWMPEAAIKSLDHWISTLKEGLVNRHIVFVGWNTVFDFPFVQFYAKKYLGRSIFGYTALDLKSMAMGLLNLPRFDYAIKSRLAKRFDSLERNSAHVALDDAKEQARFAVELFREVDALHADALITRQFAEGTKRVVGAVADIFNRQGKTEIETAVVTK